MTLSPFEVERREFGKSAIGYKSREVDDFVADVHRSLADLWQERSDLREESERLRERLTRFEQIEDQLKNTLLLAQDSAEKAHEQARRESDLIMREAGQKARDIVHSAHEEKQRLEMVLRDLFGAEQESRQRMRSLSTTILGHLDDTDELVTRGATTLRAIVQAHPEISDLRSTFADESSGTTFASEAEKAIDRSTDKRREDTSRSSQPRVTDKIAPVEPGRDDSQPTSRGGKLRHMATSEAADAFFDDPPAFDHEATTAAGSGKKRRDEATNESN